MADFQGNFFDTIVGKPFNAMHVSNDEVNDVLYSLYERKLQLRSRKYKQFTSNYNYKVVIYARRYFIRLAIDRQQQVWPII